MSPCPTYAVAFFNRGLVRQSQGDLDGALADFDRAIEITPDLAESYFYRGQLLLCRKNPSKAARDFNHFLALSHGSKPLLESRVKELMDQMMVKY